MAGFKFFTDRFVTPDTREKSLSGPDGCWVRTLSTLITGTKDPPTSRTMMTREGKMLRLILVVVVFSLVCGTIPALAAQSCEDRCQNRCTHRVLSHAACMNKCVPACQQNADRTCALGRCRSNSGSLVSVTLRSMRAPIEYSVARVTRLWCFGSCADVAMARTF